MAEQNEAKAAGGGKHYVVMHGTVALPEKEAVYQGNIVESRDFGDQLQRHLDNGAIREATPAEVRAGRAGAVGEVTLEDQIKNEEAEIEAGKARIEQLRGQIAERDARADHAARKAADKAKQGVQTSPAGRVAENK